MGHRIALCACAAAAGLACSARSATGPPTPASVALTAEPASLPADAVAQATLVATVRDAGGGPVAGAAVAFAATGTGNALVPAEAITDASGRATAALGSTVAEVKSVRAIAGSGAASDPVEVEFWRSIVVAGTFLDEAGLPIADARVAAGRDGAWTRFTTTNAHGDFELPGVRVPYDLAAVTGDASLAVVYEGLTRERSIVRGTYRWSGTRTPSAEATISATVTCTVTECGAFSPQGIVAVAGGDWTSWFDATRLADPAPVAFAWGDPGPASARLTALYWPSPSTALPPDRWWFAGRDLTLIAGEAQSVALDLAPASTVPTKVAAVPGPSVVLDRIDLALQLGTLPLQDHVVRSIPADAIAPGGLDVAIPVVPTVTPILRVNAYLADWTGASLATWVGPPPGSALNIDLPDPPRLLAPLDGAIDVGPGTPFSWTQADGLVYRLFLGPRAAAAPQLQLVTARTTGTLPDLSVLGFALPAGAGFRAVVHATGPFADVDDVAAGPVLRLGLYHELRTNVRDVVLR